MSVLQFWASHQAEFGALLLQHVFLVAVSTLVAVAIGVPLGILAARRPRLGAPIVWLVNAAQTVPSLAMFGFLLPLPFIGGLGARVAITVLIVYALLPIVRTTIAGIRSVDPALVEAGMALGMTPRQLLRQVQLPLALPSIVAGIRVAAVIGVGTATIAAAVGAGGLGEYIFRGLSMVDPTVILAGAIPSAVLALSLDGGLTLAERVVRGRGSAAAGAGRRGFRCGGRRGGARDRRLGDCRQPADPRPRFASGRRTSPSRSSSASCWRRRSKRAASSVERRLNLGGTFICDRAIRAGDIDVYVEYTGTALTAIFRQPPDTDAAARARRGPPSLRGRRPDGPRSARVREHVRHPRPRGRCRTAAVEDHRRRGRRTPPGGRRALATSSSSARTAIPGLAKTYGLTFRAPPRAMDLSLIYRALADGQVDLVAGDATSGLIDAYGLVMLEDDRHYFPPYDAVAVARSATLLAHPEVRDALAALARTGDGRGHARDEPRRRLRPPRPRGRGPRVPGDGRQR